MFKLKTSFNCVAPDGVPVMVTATASDVDFNDIYDLELQFTNLDGDIHAIEFDTDFFEEIELECFYRLSEVKEAQYAELYNGF